jgi:RNA polymerase sigma-70 factor (ECF subfamily)
VNEAREFPRLLSRLRAGDRSAADTLYRRYGPFIRAVVRRRLDPRLRPRYDSLDFVQDVWASFLALPPDRTTFPTPDALVAFLNRVAYHRVLEAHRDRFVRQRDNINRETPIDDADGEHPENLRSPTPTPSQYAIAGEALDQLLSRLPAGYQVVVQRLREGYSHAEIARMAGVSLTTVNRVIRRLKEMTGV